MIYYFYYLFIYLFIYNLCYLLRSKYKQIINLIIKAITMDLISWRDDMYHVAYTSNLSMHHA